MKLLIADDDRQTHRLIELMCQKEAFELLFASNGKEALEILDRHGEEIKLILSDVMMPQMGGEDLLFEVRKRSPQIPVVLMTSYGSIENAVHVLRAGAIDYITKPLHKEAFLHRIRSVVGASKLTAEVDQLRRELGQRREMAHILGRSPLLLDILKKLPSLAKTDASVVVYGESGTGKELVARAIHDLSSRADRPFVVINCGALPENLLETELFGYKKGAFTDASRDYDGLVKEADGGTLFLDEIGEIPLSTQVKLLRFLQQKEYKPVGSVKTSYADVRFVSATNRDLYQETRKGSFREDLYYRLNIIPLTLPSLRDRREDIPLLADAFVKKFTTLLKKPLMQWHPRSLEKLLAHAWPGNIRELENKVLQIVAMNDQTLILPEMVELTAPSSLSSPRDFWLPDSVGSFKEEKARVLTLFEETYLKRLLASHEGNISQAARYAGMDRKNFWQKMKRYKISGKDFA